MLLFKCLNVRRFLPPFSPFYEMRYIHKQMYAEHMKIYSAAISSAKSDYYSNWVTSSEGNARTLFFFCDE